MCRESILRSYSEPPDSHRSSTVRLEWEFILSLPNQLINNLLWNDIIENQILHEEDMIRETKRRIPGSKLTTKYAGKRTM